MLLDAAVLDGRQIRDVSSGISLQLEDISGTDTFIEAGRGIMEDCASFQSHEYRLSSTCSGFTEPSATSKHPATIARARDACTICMRLRNMGGQFVFCCFKAQSSILKNVITSLKIKHRGRSARVKDVDVACDSRENFAEIWACCKFGDFSFSTVPILSYIIILF